MRKTLIDLLRAGAFALAVVVCGSAGCNLPDFRFGRSRTPSPAPREENRKLSDGQVADVQLSLARSLEMAGEFDSAMDAYRKAIEKAPKLSTGYWRLAVINDKRGNVQEAAQLYREALQREPKNSEIHCDYGYSLYLQRRWAEAEDELRQALAISPQNRRAHNNLGLLLAQTERNNDALAEFRLAGCSADDAHVNLAFVSMMNQRWDLAREEFQRALDANPSSAVARAGSEKLAALAAVAVGNAEAPPTLAVRGGSARPPTPPAPARAAPAAWVSQRPAAAGLAR